VLRQNSPAAGGAAARAGIGNAERQPDTTQAPYLATTIAIAQLIPYRAGQMLAFLSVATPSGIISHDWRLMVGRDGPWIAPPSKLHIDKDGQPRTDIAGRKLYSPLIEFRDARTAARFKRQVLEAIRRQHPEVLEGVVS
jgi:hypothetical protein